MNPLSCLRFSIRVFPVYETSHHIPRGLQNYAVQLPRHRSPVDSPRLSPLIIYLLVTYFGHTGFSQNLLLHYRNLQQD